MHCLKSNFETNMIFYNLLIMVTHCKPFAWRVTIKLELRESRLKLYFKLFKENLSYDNASDYDSESTNNTVLNVFINIKKILKNP